MVDSLKHVQHLLMSLADQAFLRHGLQLDHRSQGELITLLLASRQQQDFTPAQQEALVRAMAGNPSAMQAIAQVIPLNVIRDALGISDQAALADDTPTAPLAGPILIEEPTTPVQPNPELSEPK